MPDINLTQAEADALIEMDKHREDTREWSFPDMGGSINIPLISADKRERFMLDISRGRIDFGKVKYQNRARFVVPLVRLDLGGSPHRNPDDQEVPIPHLHIYKEGFGDKWAYPVPVDHFAHMGDLMQTLEDFMRYCHIVNPPNIAGGLWV